MNLYKKIFFTSMSIALLVFVGLSAVQVFSRLSNHRWLERQYSRELGKLYTDAYATNEEGNLICSQNYVETALKKLEEQMLAEGFNRKQVEQMKDEGRQEGQARRKFWDERH